MVSTTSKATVSERRIAVAHPPHLDRPESTIQPIPTDIQKAKLNHVAIIGPELGTKSQYMQVARFQIGTRVAGQKSASLG
jgi:hypothetical protein